MEEKLYIPETTYLKSIIRSIWQVYGHPGYDREIIVPKGIAEMIFDLGESKHVQVRLNGREFPLEAPPEIVKKVIYIPLRFFAEALGATVIWDANTQTVTITSSPK